MDNFFETWRLFLCVLSFQVFDDGSWLTLKVIVGFAVTKAACSKI